MNMANAKILVVFYSMTGNIAALADSIAKGAAINGSEVRIRQVQELIPEENWSDEMKKVKTELSNIEYATMDDLVWADGIAFGSPTRFGNMTAQLQEFIDMTGKLWSEGSLVDKVGCFFTSSSTLHGGQETTIISGLLPMLHHGMIIIGLPYTEAGLSRPDFGGGSPYGASSVGVPNETDLILAIAMGKRLARITKKLIEST
jgi:NAD(P)H dehydrogenase (quinone)